VRCDHNRSILWIVDRAGRMSRVDWVICETGMRWTSHAPSVSRSSGWAYRPPYGGT
jgi:hypothetical protein